MSESPPANPAPAWRGFELEVRCPRCGYNLRLLTVARCPECGLQFLWNEIIAAAERRLEGPLFEYQWRRRPVRSFFGTVGRALFPWWLWSSTRLTVEPRVGPLLVMVPLVLLLHALCQFIPEYAWHWYSRLWLLWRWGRTHSRGFFATWYAEDYIYPLICFLVIGVTLWCTVQVFRQTIARQRVRQSQVLRLIVYSWTTLVAWKIVTYLFMTTVHFAGRSPSYAQLGRWESGPIAELVPIALCTISLCMGIAVYLRLRHGWIEGLVSIILTGLLLITLLFCMSLYYYQTMQNHWVAAIERSWPGLGSPIGWVLRHW